MSSIDKKTLDERVDTASIKKIDYAGTKRYSISSEFETASSDGGTTLNYEAYDPELQWTKEEEDRVRRIIDIRLMPFILLMSFVLNMDRTNVCKLQYLNKRKSPLLEFLIFFLSKCTFGLHASRPWFRQ